MDEELHLRPIEDARILRSAAVITVATLIGHLIPLPLAPFLFLARTPALVTAIALSALALSGVGVYSGRRCCQTQTRCRSQRTPGPVVARGFSFGCARRALPTVDQRQISASSSRDPSGRGGAQSCRRGR
jgi:hypothetical protein